MQKNGKGCIELRNVLNRGDKAEQEERKRQLVANNIIIAEQWLLYTVEFNELAVAVYMSKCCLSACDALE